MNYSESESEVCDPVLSNSWLYPIIGWFLFTFLLSAFSLLYAAVEARKKHIEIEEAYEPSDISYTDSDYSDDDGSYVSSAYVTLPDEYRGKTSTQRRSQGSSGVHNLGQIIEDDEEEEENEYDSDNIQNC